MAVRSQTAIFSRLVKDFMRRVPLAVTADTSCAGEYLYYAIARTMPLPACAGGGCATCRWWMATAP